MTKGLNLHVLRNMIWQIHGISVLHGDSLYDGLDRFTSTRKQLQDMRAT